MTRFEVVTPVINSELQKKYRYGISDCFFFGCRIADAFDASRGMVETYSGSYSTLLGAQRALRRRGFYSLGELFASHLEQVVPAQAQVGDLAVINLSDGDHVAVCLGARFLTRTERGKAWAMLTQVKSAFRT